MNKSDLIEVLSENENLTRTKAEEIVNLVFSKMTNALVIDTDLIRYRFHRYNFILFPPV